MAKQQKKITGKGITEETSYGRNGKPKTSNGINLLKEDGDYNHLLKKTDSELLNIMWGGGGLGKLDTVGSSDLRKILETRYRKNTGEELRVNMPNSYWTSSIVNDRDGLLSKIREATQKELITAKRRNDFICSVNCSHILDQAQLNFRSDLQNPSLMIPMGGVQEVMVITKKVVKDKNTFNRIIDTKLRDFGESLKRYNDDIYEITINIILKDWFAVDEGDFSFSDYSSGWSTTKSLVTAMGREALTAFWILQHQRSYRPFVWNAIFESKIQVFKP